jgi:hypothetical protein
MASSLPIHARGRPTLENNQFGSSVTADGTAGTVNPNRVSKGHGDGRVRPFLHGTRRFSGGNVLHVPCHRHPIHPYVPELGPARHTVVHLPCQF